MAYYINTNNNVNLFVEDIGNGKPVLFIHGWPVNHKMYEYQLEVLPEYGIRCIALDLRGFGKSDRPFSSYSYNEMADDIRGVIDKLKLTNLTLVAFSIGGAIATRYMSRHAGHNISQLILAGAAAPSFVQRNDFPYGIPVSVVNSIINHAYQDRPKMLAEFGKMFFASEISREFNDWFLTLGFEASGQGTIKAAESLRDEDLRNDLAAIRIPTTILHGRKDQICPYELAQIMHQNIPHSKLIPFENSGHGLFYDEKDKFNQELLKVLL